MFIPFYWAVLNALSPATEAFALPPNWLPTGLTFQNVLGVFDSIPFGLMAFNSLKISTLVTVGALTTSALAAYAFARLEFPFREVIFVVFLAALMVPQQVTVIPTFILIRELGLIDSHEAVYLPAFINVLAIFLLRQFFLTIPRDLDEAAKIDGAGHLRILWHIIIPLSGPALSALAIFIFQLYWNDFFWANIFLSSPDKMTLPVGLVYLQGFMGGGQTVVLFAAIAMVVLPVLILFVFLQRTLTEGIAMTGMGGQ
jgi:multiple sugar transport system permease protein